MQAKAPQRRFARSPASASLLLALGLFASGCGPGPAAPGQPADPRQAGAGTADLAATAPEPAVSTKDLCGLMGALWICQAKTLPEAEQQKTMGQREMIWRLVMKMPEAVRRETCMSTTVSFALTHAANPGVRHCVGAWRQGVPLYTPTCHRVIAGIRCLQRRAPSDQRAPMDKALAAWQRQWQLLPSQVQPTLCRTHWLRFQSLLAPSVLARCQPADPTLREPPMPALPAHLPPACVSWVKRFRCLLGLASGRVRWELRTELRQEITRWHHVDRALLPRMCGINGFLLKERLEKAKLQDRCPAP